MMVAAGLDPFLKGDSGRNTRGLLRIIILCTIAAAAIASRLFSVIRKLPKSLTPESRLPLPDHICVGRPVLQVSL